MFTSKTLRRAVLVAASLIAFLGLAETASASAVKPIQTRRAEVVQRLNHQEARIAHKVAIGKMSQARAARLLREVRGVRHEERVMASLNHGRITKGEQQALNVQENAISRRIAR